MRMIADAMLGKIDMILTKSISRFARNTLDTLKYVRMLREKKIAIFFEEENLNISSHVLLGLIGYNCCYGYNYNIETKEITINEDEASIVRYIDICLKDM